MGVICINDYFVMVKNVNNNSRNVKYKICK